MSDYKIIETSPDGKFRKTDIVIGEGSYKKVWKALNSKMKFLHGVTYI